MDIYQAAFESSPDLILCVGSDGRILRANGRAEPMLGYTREELLGQTLDILLPERFRSAHAGFCEDYFLSPMTRPMGTGRLLFSRRKDGSEVPVDVMLSSADTPRGRIVIAVMRDETEKRKTERKILELLERLQLSAEAAGISYWTYDQAEDRFWCDDRFAALFGGSAADFTTLESVRERIHPEDRDERRRRAQESLEKHGKYESEFRVVLPDGIQRWVADLGRYIETHDSHRPAFAGVAFDITDRKESERRQSELSGLLQSSLKEIKLLRGLLPVCSHCKKIRDERGEWQPMESYIRSRSEVEFSHGICPTCLKDYYSEFIPSGED